MDVGKKEDKKKCHEYCTNEEEEDGYKELHDPEANEDDLLMNIAAVEVESNTLAGGKRNEMETCPIED